MMRVEGVVMLVAGSTDGIGRETAIRLAEVRAIVLVLGRAKRPYLQTGQLIQQVEETCP
jgi:NAD(P)-dependent dehydrogenase (short-subunit alcohol dehydrogenase family)